MAIKIMLWIPFIITICTTHYTSSFNFEHDENMQAIHNISLGINRFTVELHKIISSNMKSFTVSPLSVALVLMMAACGAAGENAKEMKSVLNFDYNNSVHRTGIYSMIEMFNAIQASEVKLANKLYVAAGIEIDPYYANLIKKTFNSSIENVKFENCAETAQVINQWCAEQTHQRIEKIIDPGFRGKAKFLPSKNFIEVRNDIKESKLFNIIKMMPKGAVLHAHDTAIVSEEWLFNNVTFRDNLYICDEAENLQLKFFHSPTDDCNWQLLKELRKNETFAAEINSRIRKEFSMMTDNPDRMYPDVNSAWKKFMNIFILITPMLTYRPVYEDHFYQGLKELYEDNVLYLELRSTLPPLYELNGTQYNPIDVVGIYKKVTERFIKDHPDFIGVKIIFAPLRIMSTSQLDEYIDTTLEIKRKFPNFFAGFDLVGQEDTGNSLELYAEKLQRMTNEVGFFFHAGETNWYGSKTDRNLLDAVLLNTTRIGHGYAIVKHPEILKIVKERKIAIEICPISNQVLGLVKDLRNHPANILFAGGFPVVVSNDDPGLWGSKALSYDFYEAFVGMMSRDADIRALKQLAINSIIYSSMSGCEKQYAHDVWTRKWSEFLCKINY